MEDFLRKIKLVEDISIRLDITSSEFVSALRLNVEKSNINNIFSGLFEVFSSNEKEYKGLVDSRGFHIRKKKRFFDKKKGTTNAKGTFRTNANTLIINTTISAFSVKQLLISSLLLVCYLTFVVYGVGNINSFQEVFNNISIFFLLFLVGMLLFVWFSLKNEVTNMKKDLQKQFQSIATKTNHSK